MTVQIDYSSNRPPAAEIGRSRWPHLLVGYVAFSIAVCIYSVIGIRYAQRKFGYNEIFEPATGTPFYDDMFVVLPTALLFFGAVTTTVVGAVLAVRRKRPMEVVANVVTIWPTLILFFFGMTLIWWEDASP